MFRKTKNALCDMTIVDYYVKTFINDYNIIMKRLNYNNFCIITDSIVLIICIQIPKIFTQYGLINY